MYYSKLRNIYYQLPLHINKILSDMILVSLMTKIQFLKFLFSIAIEPGSEVRASKS